MRKVLKDHGIAADGLAKGDVFQQLGHGSNAVCGSVVEDAERCLGVDQQGRDCAVVAGEGHVSVHVLALYFKWSDHHSNVAKRMGGSCAQVGEPVVEKTGRP